MRMVLRLASAWCHYNIIHAWSLTVITFLQKHNDGKITLVIWYGNVWKRTTKPIRPLYVHAMVLFSFETTIIIMLFTDSCLEMCVRMLFVSKATGFGTIVVRLGFLFRSTLSPVVCVHDTYALISSFLWLYHYRRRETWVWIPVDFAETP